jgi:hypothetical protein
MARIDIVISRVDQPCIERVFIATHVLRCHDLHQSQRPVIDAGMPAFFYMM